jgi:long-chain acyl-CoA synthetase
MRRIGRVKTMPEMFCAVAQQNADRTAVVDGQVAVTYAQLERRVDALAGHLQEMGVRVGDRVGLMLPNSLDFLVSYRAIAASGAIVVPLNEHYQLNELLYFLDVCRISVLITCGQFAPLCQRVLSQYDAPCQLILAEQHATDSAHDPTLFDQKAVQIDPDAPLMFQFSSGSTGRPKQIGRTHRNLLFELDKLVATLGVSNQDRFIGVAPFSHVNGLVRSMMTSQRAGATLYPVSKFERRAVARLIEDAQISVFIAVPFMFIMLAQGRFRPRPDFSSLRLAISSSARMPAKHNEQFKKRFGMYVRQLYGSTETGTISANLSVDVANSLDSVGTPIQGVEVEVFAEDGDIAKLNEMGEFAVRSAAVVKGYSGRDDLNKQAFRNGYFLTGDLGTRDANGLLSLIGRKKFFINKAGFKIDPREVEELLETHPGISEVVVVGVPTSFGDEKVKAVVVANEQVTPEEIVAHCQGKIADFKIPSMVEFRDRLPKSPTGKIRRGMLLGE